MPTMKCALSGSLFLAITLPVAAASVDIPKLLTFADAKQVRIDWTAQAEALGEVEFRATIAHSKTGEVLWQGPLAQTNFQGAVRLSHMVSSLKPQLWNPTTPNLYQLKLEAVQGGKTVAEKVVRFGFRSFESRDGQLFLNGQPVFLRGIAINPPGRTVPEQAAHTRKFAEDYVRFVKSRNVNAIRMSEDSQAWFDVCDELGMMVFQGRYGAPPGDAGKDRASTDLPQVIEEYRALFETYATHPSILIYILSNELPTSGARGQQFHELLNNVYTALQPWDPTRLYIGNAGYGEGREGDICDVHRYWGWYYCSFLTYYNLRDGLSSQWMFGDPAKNQPLTFTECVGSYTSAYGEFNIVRVRQLSAQLGWTGHAEDQRSAALEYQSFLLGQATESFRRMRPLNPRLSGIMPFTILFYNWEGIRSFDEMKPKPAMEQMGLSYQPVLLSWESWSPHLYAGAQAHPIVHVINDTDDRRALTGAEVHYTLRSANGRELCAGKVAVPDLPYYGTWSHALELDLPQDLATGPAVLSGVVMADSKIISSNYTKFFLAGQPWKRKRTLPNVALYDPSGKTERALKTAGLTVQSLSSPAPLPKNVSALIIGQGIWDQALAGAKPILKNFVREGGRVVCLSPEAVAEPGWLPVPATLLSGSANDTNYPARTRPFAEQMNVNPERPNHPVFAGLNRSQFSFWSDYSGWDQSKPGFPKVYPVTAGFKLSKMEDLAHTAILANYDRGLEGVALCEMFDGAGSVLVSGFDLVNRVGLDPVADRLLANLVSYAASGEGHEPHPLISQPIRWGKYATECGLITGPLNGLIVNAEWVAPPTAPDATPLPPNTGSWNMKPGDQFVPAGRTPYGPYGYTTAVSVKDHNPDSPIGTGMFWASLPPGKSRMLSVVKNIGPKPGELTIEINGQTAGETATINDGQTVRVESPFAPGTRDVAVRFTGSKTIVLVETRFE